MQQAARRTDERPPVAILLVTRLLAEQYDALQRAVDAARAAAPGWAATPYAERCRLLEEEVAGVAAR